MADGWYILSSLPGGWRTIIFILNSSPLSPLSSLPPSLWIEQPAIATQEQNTFEVSNNSWGFAIKFFVVVAEQGGDPSPVAAMASAVFNPLAFGAPSLSVRCSASGDQSPATSNGSTTAPASVKMTPALTSSGLPPVSRTAEASSMSVLHPGLEFANLMFFRGSYNAQVCGFCTLLFASLVP